MKDAILQNFERCKYDVYVWVSPNKKHRIVCSYQGDDDVFWFLTEWSEEEQSYQGMGTIPGSLKNIGEVLGVLHS